jgi:class 3 adenylate cyclase
VPSGDRSKSFSAPDEIYRHPGVEQHAVTLGDLMVARSTLEPGWRWATHMRPLVGTEWCQAHHIGTVVSGSLAFVYPDGATIVVRPGDVYDMPPGHDGYVVGEEPCTVIEWSGIRAFSGFRAGATGRRLVTLLFTDVVDSTSIASSIGDVAWNDKVSTHFETARRRLEEFDGREIKTTGDGMLATFDGPANAVHCAAAISRDAHRDGFRIRAGVHTGEVEVAGADVRGIAVNEAARIMAAAGPDEILVSEVTRTLTTGLEFDDRGVHALKGVGDRRLYAYHA